MIQTRRIKRDGQISTSDIWLSATSRSPFSIGVRGIMADNKGNGQGKYSAGKKVPDKKIIGNITAFPSPEPAAGEFAQADNINPIFINTIVPITTIM